MKPIKTLIATLLIVGTVAAKSIIIFPVNGVNTDESFSDAFGALLSNKYQKLTENDVISPVIVERKLREHQGEQEAVLSALDAGEYIEIDAVGLYVSRREKDRYYEDSSGVQRIVVTVESDDDDKSDQALLDNSKTIVTATKFSADHKRLHQVELTFLTYGDIEEGSDRIARALYNNISIEEAMTMTNVTRRDGMGENKTFLEKRKGIKIGGYYPYVTEQDFEPMVSIGYNQKMEAEKYFIEFGASGRFASKMGDADARNYSGIVLEMGGSYFLTRGVVATYIGGGIMPGLELDFFDDDGVGLFFAPYAQLGVMLPRTSKTVVYVNLRIAQHVLPISTGSSDYDDGDDYSYSYSYSNLPARENHPFEFGLEFGIGF